MVWLKLIDRSLRHAGEVVSMQHEQNGNVVLMMLIQLLHDMMTTVHKPDQCRSNTEYVFSVNQQFFIISRRTDVFSSSQCGLGFLSLVTWDSS